MSHSIPPLSDYPMPSVVRMNALREDFLDLLYSGTGDLLPAVVEALQNLLASLRDSERLLADQVRAGLVSLDNHRWDEPAAAGLDDLEQDAQRDVQRLASRGKAIADNLLALEKIRLPTVAQRIAMLTEQRTTLEAAMQTQQARIERLDAQVVEMNVVINAFDTPGLIKLFNGLIPLEQDIDLVTKTLATGVVSPALLKAASARFVENLSGIVEGRKLTDVIKARNRLVDERNAMGLERQAWQTTLEGYSRELAQLPNVAALDALRSQWLEQAQLLSRTWTAQVDDMKRQTSLDELASRLSSMTHYLLAVRRLYEAA